MRRLAAETSGAPSLDALMGLEGAAAARYFGLWATAWQQPWHFPGRNRRPPRDPVNALLSLGYTLALNPVGQQAALRGLDVSLGFLHAPHSGRPGADIAFAATFAGEPGAVGRRDGRPALRAGLADPAGREGRRFPKSA
jgi:CRISPR-associated endonuclease Cas1